MKLSESSVALRSAKNWARICGKRFAKLTAKLFAEIIMFYRMKQKFSITSQAQNCHDWGLSVFVAGCFPIWDIPMKVSTSLGRQMLLIVDNSQTADHNLCIFEMWQRNILTVHNMIELGSKIKLCWYQLIVMVFVKLWL